MSPDPNPKNKYRNWWLDPNSNEEYNRLLRSSFAHEKLVLLMTEEYRYAL